MNEQTYLPIDSMGEVLTTIYKLNSKLSKKGTIGGGMEGNSGNFPPQTNDFVKYARLPEVINILEIGFNAGHSAATFLSASSKVKVTSFDIGIHDYLKIGKKEYTIPGAIAEGKEEHELVY